MGDSMTMGLYRHQWSFNTWILH